LKGFRINKEKYILGQLELYGGKKVLHIGCTNSPNTVHRWNSGTLLHNKICGVSNRLKISVTGIDIDNDGIQFLKEKMPNEEIINLDAQNLYKYFGERKKFDLIIAGDVIEHLPNPGLFLISCANVLSDDGKIIISTANCFGIIRFVKSLFFHEAVHPEHTAYYSHKTLKRLLHLNGLEIDSFGYYSSEPITTFSINLFVSNCIESVACMVWPHYSEGIIIKGRRKN